MQTESQLQHALLGERLPDDLVQGGRDLRAALDRQLAAVQDTGRARQGVYTALRKLPDDRYFCYQVREEGELGLVVPESRAIHKARIMPGRVALGKIVRFLPDTYTHIGELVPLVPNPRDNRIKSLRAEKTRVCIALFDLAKDGNLTTVDEETATALVDKEYTVIDPAELVNIFRTRSRANLRVV